MFFHTRSVGSASRLGRLATRLGVFAASLLLLALPALPAGQGGKGNKKPPRSGGETGSTSAGTGSGGSGSGGSSGGSGSTGGGFSAPEIEIALLSGAVLVVGGAALILRDRRARRRAG